MGAVAICANRGLHDSCGQGVPVNAVLVSQEWLRTEPASLHDELLAVARSTGPWNVRVIDL